MLVNEAVKSRMSARRAVRRRPTNTVNAIIRAVELYTRLGSPDEERMSRDSTCDTTDGFI
jgi:hypothetical protein